MPKTTKPVEYFVLLSCLAHIVHCIPKDLPESVQQTIRNTVHAAQTQIPPGVATADRSKKYYMHEIDNSGGINDGQGYSHQVHAIACSMMEAKMLNRTLILPDALLLMKTHSFQDRAVFKPLKDILNISRLQDYVNVIVTPAPNQFVQDLVAQEWRTMLMAPKNLYADELTRYNHIDVIVRPHRMVYWSWFEVCFNDRMFEHWLKDADILKNQVLRPTDETLDIIHSMQKRMGHYCSLHVRRGDKLPLVPGLDEATRPANILEKIRPLCPPGSSLYLGTNEGTPGFFDPIKEHYKLFTFKDFADILVPRGFIAKDEGKDDFKILDNFALYQVEVEVMLDGSPFMDTFCVLYRQPVDGSGHAECNVPENHGKNHKFYGMPNLGIIG